MYAIGSGIVLNKWKLPKCMYSKIYFKPYNKIINDSKYKVFKKYYKIINIKSNCSMES